MTFIRLYSNVCDYAIYNLNYHEGTYFTSAFARFNHKEKYVITVRVPKLL